MASLSFERGIDPKRKLGIGQYALIKEWLDKHGVENYNITEDFFIDVEGDVWLEGYHINDVANIPDYIKFRNVTGKFVLTNNHFQKLP
jgi:hypothetical protein